CNCVHLYIFFFSSRRRHTRFSRDWSSDVCSSDLRAHNLRAIVGTLLMLVLVIAVLMLIVCAAAMATGQESVEAGRKLVGKVGVRSEERRVGKESRSRWSADDEGRRS